MPFVLLNDAKRIIKIYLKYFINSAKIHFYYNDVFLVLLGGLARDSVAVAGIYFITRKFISIGGWDMDELLFQYSLLYVSYGLSMLFFAGVRSVENDVANGNFDRYLVRPVSVFFQAVVAKVDLLTTASYCLLGVLLFLYSSGSAGVFWDVRKVTVLVLSLLGGALIQSALLLLGSLLSFWTVKSGNVKFILFFNIRAFCVYPINIYPRGLMYLLTFILPFAFANYFPAKYLLELEDIPAFSLFYTYGSILAGTVVFTLVFALWKFAVKNYKSTGN